jgi:hypothetical protein
MIGRDDWRLDRSENLEKLNLYLWDIVDTLDPELRSATPVNWRDNTVVLADDRIVGIYNQIVRRVSNSEAIFVYMNEDSSFNHFWLPALMEPRINPSGTMLFHSIVSGRRMPELSFVVSCELNSGELIRDGALVEFILKCSRSLENPQLSSVQLPSDGSSGLLSFWESHLQGKPSQGNELIVVFDNSQEGIGICRKELYLRNGLHEVHEYFLSSDTIISIPMYYLDSSSIMFYELQDFINDGKLTSHESYDLGSELYESSLVTRPMEVVSAVSKEYIYFLSSMSGMVTRIPIPQIGGKTRHPRHRTSRPTP